MLISGPSGSTVAPKCRSRGGGAPATGAGTRFQAVSCKPPIAVFAPSRPPAALSARPEYARYEDRPPPCRTTGWITKPIDRGLQDTA
jgi:hypothetical protein